MSIAMLYMSIAMLYMSLGVFRCEESIPVVKLALAENQCFLLLLS